MFACCIPKSGGCRLRKAHPANTSPRWGCRARAPQRLWPFGRKDRKATDEIGKRLADNRPMSLAEGVPSQWSPEAGTGDCPGWPLTPPRPLSLVVPHLTAVQELEPTEAEPEAAPPSEELKLAPSSWAGVVPAATSAEDQEPAGDLAPAHGEPATTTAPAPSPACAPVLAPDSAPALGPAPATVADPVPPLAPAPVPDLAPVPAPIPSPAPTFAGPAEPHPEPTVLRAQLLVQLHLVISPEPHILPGCFIPSPCVLSLWCILTLILAFQALYAVYDLF
ncbi:vegetative cell wall protein gp1-like isoform X2 [Ailuropoda melanoleuca]|uniref:vegetative cell wall protein gp1-like isoform X2 n=1 Tax=Ailuropoda melanoleuca TaxID=9646 RepID=UPI0014945C06|nr:vegetative cell wall protein gp1-like isoform X2 [Ailuropoda melanoleuca]